MGNSVRQAVAEAAEVLQAAAIAEPRMEAVSLLTHALQVNRTFVITNLEDTLKEEKLHTFRELVARRARREPLQYITGHQEFFELDFEVTPDVLIPRPETEIVVEAALDVVKDVQSPLIADMGTGSGCIAISLLHKREDARAVATDTSANALRVAQRNALRHGVGDRLALMQSDCFCGLEKRSRFSLIVSNPPYVPNADIETLQPEVREYEPLSALLSGADGLSHIRVLLSDSPSFLRAGGYLIFEIGFGQRDDVAGAIEATVWEVVEIRNDLQAIPRTFVLKKR